jgi:hypothetical protein
MGRSAQPGELEHAEHDLSGLLPPLQGAGSSPSLQVRTLFRLFRPTVILYACMMEKTVTKMSHLKESSVVVAQNEPLQYRSKGKNKKKTLFSSHDLICVLLFRVDRAYAKTFFYEI